MTSTKKQDDSHPKTNEQTTPFNPQLCELIYVNDQQPGIARQRLKESFRYIDSAGKVITDKDTLARINALKIPPAYENVWICPSFNGHLQATGRDARGRKQYRYHERWTQIRDADKSTTKMTTEHFILSTRMR